MRFSISVSGGLAVLAAFVLAACAGDDPVDPAQDDDAPPDYVLVPLSGDGQVGKVGKRLPELLEVQVTNASGQSVAGAEVVWSTSTGTADLTPLTFSAAGTSGSTVSDTTGIDGVSRVIVRPTDLGTLIVTADAGGSGTPAVSFTTEVEVLLIGFYFDPVEGSYFSTSLARWHPGDDFVVSVGTPVEWQANSSGSEKVRIRSTNGPSSGLSFDSGDLANGDRFQFVPSVAGSWDFVEEGTGTAGTLTAR